MAIKEFSLLNIWSQSAKINHGLCYDWMIVKKAYVIFVYRVQVPLCFTPPGGYDGSDFLASVECYDPDKEEWEEVTSMSCGRSGHGVAVTVEPCLRWV